MMKTAFTQTNIENTRFNILPNEILMHINDYVFANELEEHLCIHKQKMQLTFNIIANVRKIAPTCVRGTDLRMSKTNTPKPIHDYIVNSIQDHIFGEDVEPTLITYPKLFSCVKNADNILDYLDFNAKKTELESLHTWHHYVWDKPLSRAKTENGMFYKQKIHNRTCLTPYAIITAGKLDKKLHSTRKVADKLGLSYHFARSAIIIYDRYEKIFEQYA